MARIFIIDDDELFSACLRAGIQKQLGAVQIRDKKRQKSLPTSGKAVENSNLATLQKRPLEAPEILEFKNPIDAMYSLEDPLPSLIFLDVLLPGADAFTFLHELLSYPDTAKIPIVIVSALDLSKFDLKLYGVRAILNKETLTPEDIFYYVERYSH